MDPTAPKNDPKPQDPPGGSQPPPLNPIQPGQFVVVGEEDGVFKEPPGPTAPPISTQEQTPQAPASQFSPPMPSSSSSPTSPASFTPPSPLPTSNLTAAEQPPFVPIPPEPVAQPNSGPNPTPYFAPQTPTSPSLSATNSSGENPSIIKKLRVVSIIIILLILVAIIAGVIWFFLLKNKASEPMKTQAEQPTSIEEPSPPPKKTGAGFADLPSATSEGMESTPSGQ